DEGRADGACPEPAPVGGDLHAGKHDGVGELADEVGDERGGENAGCGVEDAAPGFMAVPRAFGGQGAGKLEGEHGDGVADETEPDDAAGGLEAVYLGEDVADDVGDGEGEEPGVCYPGAE